MEQKEGRALNKGEGFTFSALALSVTCSAAAECLLTAEELPAAHAALALGLMQALALSFISALLTVAFEGRHAAPLLRALLCACFALELAQTVRQAQSLSWQQFGSKAVIGVVPLLLLYGATCAPHQLGRVARPLRWAVLAGAVVCALGLGGLARWQGLLEAPRGRVTVPLYAEYFAAPFICERGERRRSAWLPLCAFAVQAGFCVGWQLVFGSGTGYATLELLRAFSVGAFSRVDAFLVLIWLLPALWRVCFLSAAMRLLMAGPSREEGRRC